MTGKSAIYARVSKPQAGAQDPENQLQELRAACPGSVEYVDLETGTGKRRRSEYERMMEDAQARRFDVVAVWSLDRLGREGVLKTLLDVSRLASCGVKVRSLREPWLDPESPTYGLLLPVFAWIAEQEARRIGERTRAGLARARAAGVRLGRPPLAPKVVERMKAMSTEGMGVRAIARALRVSPGAVSKTLKKTATKPQGLAVESAGPSPA